MHKCILYKVSMAINKEQLGLPIYKFACAKALTCKDLEMTENTVLAWIMCNYDKSRVWAF